MDIAVVKGDGRHRAVATTGDRSVQLAVADYGPALPHELAHFVVERALGLRHGLWGLLADGADLAAVMTFSARSPKSVQPPTDPLVATHVDDLLESEQLVAGLYQLGAGARGDHGGEPAQAAGIREEIDALNALWQDLPVGEAIHLTWS